MYHPWVIYKTKYVLMYREKYFVVRYDFMN